MSKGIKSRTTEAIKEILLKPYGGIMLVGPLRGLWKLKVGKYRLLYEIDEKDKSIIFHDVELRKKVYK
ncbi:MAG: type II toxin-antitoxin system RelE/ParE family toxin [Candidatus Bathyarchaeia archaeon]|jgi:mRNA-degrading endonuclease RelE of RelBE toxin-antitoxin system